MTMFVFFLQIQAEDKQFVLHELQAGRGHLKQEETLALGYLYQLHLLHFYWLLAFLILREQYMAKEGTHKIK